MTIEEKQEILLEMARNTTGYKEDYAPHLEDGLIMHSSPCIIKSTLKGRPAWTDGQIAMVYSEGSVHAQMPEYRAEWFHKSNDSLDALADSVLTTKPIYRVLYDDIGMWFNDGASIQRCFFDLFWVTHRNNGLRFEQDTQNVNSTILVYDESGLIGVISPRSFGEKETDLLPIVQTLIAYYEFSTEEPCSKCGSKNDVWLWAKDRTIKTEGIPICHWCYLDSEGFHEWLVKEMESAMETEVATQ